MKLDDFRSNDNIEDRRGQGGGGFGFPGGRGGRINIPMGGGRAGGFSFKTILFLIVLYFILKMLGIDLLQVLNGGGGYVGPSTQSGYEEQVAPPAGQWLSQVAGSVSEKFLPDVVSPGC